jgi:hypothetical protein
MSQRKAYIISLFALTFLIGAGSGYLLRGSFDPFSGPSQSNSSISGIPEPPGQALHRNRPERSSDSIRERLVSELNLSDHQVAPFFEITLRHRRLIRELSEDHHLQVRRAMRSQSDSLNTELRTLLSDEQYLRWIELQSRLMREQNRVRQQSRIRERE